MLTGMTPRAILMVVSGSVVTPNKYVGCPSVRFLVQQRERNPVLIDVEGNAVGRRNATQSF